MVAVLGFLLLGQQARASLSWEDWANGSFHPEESLDSIYERREASKQATLDASNFIVRNLAASKLEEKPYICKEYQFNMAESVLRVACDDRGSISINLNGQPTEYTRPDGSVMKVIAQVEGTKITQAFAGEEGGLKVVYSFSKDGVVVTKSISSTYLGQPLSVEVFYQKHTASK